MRRYFNHHHVHQQEHHPDDDANDDDVDIKKNEAFAESNQNISVCVWQRLYF